VQQSVIRTTTEAGAIGGSGGLAVGVVTFTDYPLFYIAEYAFTIDTALRFTGAIGVIASIIYIAYSIRQK